MEKQTKGSGGKVVDSRKSAGYAREAKNTQNLCDKIPLFLYQNMILKRLNKRHKGKKMLIVNWDHDDVS